MPTDFRASQIQTNKIIASGSTGTSTNALLLIYPISKQSGSNQGFINTSAFGLTGIGTDVFMFVSGAIGTRGSAGSNATTVFGGDVHISGVLTFASASAREFWFSTTANTAFTTGSVEITGSVLLGTGSFAQGQYLTIKTVAVGTTMNSEYNNWLHIAAGNVVASGSGGKLILSGGNGGYTSGSDAQTPGGNVEIYGGEAGASVGDGTAALSAGGGITLQGGLGAGTPTNSTRDAGAGGSIYATAGNGGSSSIDTTLGGNTAGAGGLLSFTAGDGGGVAGADNWATGGDGGAVNFYGGTGGTAKNGVPGTGGSISISAGQGGAKTKGSGSFGGAGGNITISAGTPGSSGVLNHGPAGTLTFTGGVVKDTHWFLSASSLQFGGGQGAGLNANFRRIFFSTPIDPDTAGFPGTDIFMYVSGPINQQGMTGNNKVVLPDLVISGNIWFKSSSQNPLSLILGGNRDGGVGFSGSNVVFYVAKNSSNPAKVYFGPITTYPNVAPAGDAIFVVSGTIDGAFGNVSSSVAVMPDTYFSGTVRVAGQISGSLQKTNSGLNYIIGSGLTINTNSLGQVELTGSSATTVPVVTSVSAAYSLSLSTTNSYTMVNSSGSNITLVLPVLTENNSFTIKKTSTDTNYINLSPATGSVSIEGQTIGLDYILSGSTGTNRPAWTLLYHHANLAWWIL